MVYLKFTLSGEWITGEEKKMVKGHIDIPDVPMVRVDIILSSLYGEALSNLVLLICRSWKLYFTKSSKECA